MTFKARQGRKSKISSVEMGCLNNFPSPTELCALQTEGNISFKICLLWDGQERGVFRQTVMDRPKRAANLTGELFIWMKWKGA